MTNKRNVSPIFLKGSLFLALLLVISLGFSSEARAEVKFSGQATGAKVTLIGLSPVVLSDTGPLPESGGALEASLLDVEVPGVLSATVLHATTVGQGDRSRSEASAAEVSISVNGNTIGAGFLMSRAEAACTAAGPAVQGGSEVVALVINGIPVTVGTEPNFTIDLPGGGKIIINEQKEVINDNKADISVTALHVIIPGVADIEVAKAHADVICGGGPDCAGKKDFITGGGWIMTLGGSKGTFGVGGGLKNGELWGHLVYIDHGTKMRVKGTAVTGYHVTGPTSRRIEGDCEINGAAGTYTVDVSDMGEPGKGMDTFSLRLSGGYTASGNLSGGNIQLHNPCR
jgi:hypothetical protein